MQLEAIEKEGETVDEALQLALTELDVDLESVEYDVLDEGSQGDDSEGSQALVRVWLKNPEEVALAKKSLESILKDLGLEAKIESEYLRSERTLNLNIESETDSGILIGRQGQTLDALQYLLQLIVNTKDFNIVLDVANYRERHRAHLVSVAEKVSERVLRRRRRITLRPMDARDRKIVHEAVKSFSELSSSSVGVEPNRRVVISLKRADYAMRNRSRSRYRRGRNYNN